MKRLVRTVAAAAVLVLAVTSSAIGTLPAAGAPDVAATAARLDALTVRIHGSVEELRAAELLNYHRVEGGVAACMRAAGRPYRQVPYVSLYRDFTDADVGYGTGRGSVADSLTEGGRRHILNEVAFARLQRAGAIERQAAPHDVPVLNACTAKFEHRGYFDVDPPTGVEELRFEELLRPVYSNPAIISATEPYRECMRVRYGHDVDDRTDFLFMPRFRRADAPADGEPPSRAWTDGVEATKAAFAADADCRRPAYEIAMRLLAPLLAPWERRNADRLAGIRKQWRQRVADAAELRP